MLRYSGKAEKSRTHRAEYPADKEYIERQVSVPVFLFPFSGENR